MERPGRFALSSGHRWTILAGLGLTALTAACGSSGSVATGGDGIDVVVESTPSPAPPPAATPAPAPVSAALTHDFGEITLGPGEEIASQCVAWTLQNEKPLYVSKVTLANGGSYHHSNWFVVPDDLYPGPDGFFRCRDRDFDELTSAISGTVIFAQSTQSLVEEQAFAEGAVIKIPPRHKVVAGIHVLNPSAREVSPWLRMSFELLHPRDVDVILAPFRLTYRDLQIPPRSLSRFTTECDLRALHDAVFDEPFSLKLYWVLPHYHYLGNHFRVEVIGGSRDGEVLHGLDTFNAEANGKALDPPLDLSDARGLRMTCGYRNPTDEEVGWGIGDQEMCVMLGLADSSILYDASAPTGSNQVLGPVDGIVMNEGGCEGIAVPRNPAQTLPSAEEMEAPLYVPESLPTDAELPAVPDCVDTPATALAEPPTTIESIQGGIFQGSCTFSACHDSVDPVAGLDLETDPYAALLAPLRATSTDLPLVSPGDPDGSWLYQVLSRCEPTDEAGRVFAHMPRNAPTLLQPELVAKVRDWILRGAPED